MITHEESINCPHCGRINDLHASMLEHRVPSPGDGSICWKCRGVSIFIEVNGTLALLPATAEVFGQTEVTAVLEAMNEARYPSEAYALFQGRR
jgi:hypothetical protein